MPFTYLSHQAPVLAVKMRWPALVDGTAMVAGLAAATVGHPGLPGQIIRLSLGAGLGVVVASLACHGEVRRSTAPR